MKTVFFQLNRDDDKEAVLAADAVAMNSPRRFEVEVREFSNVPRSPFSYWVTQKVRTQFQTLERVEGGGRVVLSGLKTLSDERFIRASWEVPREELTKWPLLAKGGSFSPFFSDIHLRVNWSTQGGEISIYGYQRRPREGFGAASRGLEAYFRPGLTWSRRSQKGFSLRVLPPGCIFADKGPAIFVSLDDSESLLVLLAIGNSRTFRYLLDLQMAFGSFEVGVVQRTPLPALPAASASRLSRLALKMWDIGRTRASHHETSDFFEWPRLLQVEGDSLRDRLAAIRSRDQALDAEQVCIQNEIDELVASAYTFEGGSTSTAWPDSPELTTAESEDDDSSTEGSPLAAGVSERKIAEEFLSWGVGVVFRRHNLERRWLPDQEPFDTVRPLATAYASSTGENICVNDEGSPLDLFGQLRALCRKLSAGFERDIWPGILAAFDDGEEGARLWLSEHFFTSHLSEYSQSRRKAPIYWPIGVRDDHYRIWLYAHSITQDTLFRVQNDIVEPKIVFEERKLSEMKSSAGPTPSAEDRRAIAAQMEHVEGLRTLLDELGQLSPLWKPTLTDGILIAKCPLWRVVPDAAWQKELRTTWDQLCEGKYDWSHQAMHLWPERVLPKCAEDRSLAIAHGLEDVFWVEGEDGKWSARAKPTRSVEELVRGRTAPAVKAALKSLLEAPPLATGSGRGRRGSKKKSGGSG